MLRSLAYHNIAALLSDRFRVLVSGDRTALPRQQTLRALIDWSYELLSDDERVLFRRLAVFAGGWTLDAAEAVASGGGVAQARVLDLLADLVDKSLVMMDPEGGRYRLLETVRQYAEQRLTAPESQALRTRHLDLQEGVSIARTLDDARLVVSILNTFALAALGQGDRAGARRHCEEALDLATRNDNKRGVAVASNGLAHVHRLNGDLDAAEPL